jgi:hypothetical protein
MTIGVVSSLALSAIPERAALWHYADGSGDVRGDAFVLGIVAAWLAMSRHAARHVSIRWSLCGLNERRRLMSGGAACLGYCPRL